MLAYRQSEANTSRLVFTSTEPLPTGTVIKDLQTVDSEGVERILSAIVIYTIGTKVVAYEVATPQCPWCLGCGEVTMNDEPYCLVPPSMGELPKRPCPVCKGVKP